MKREIISAIVIAMFSLTIVSAFGVSAPYWGDNPMQAYPGMVSDVQLNVQNVAGVSEDVVAVLEVSEGNSIASLKKSEYIVSYGETLDVPLRISIPSDAAIGAKYPVKIDVKTKSASDEGMVSLSAGMLLAFDVIIAEKPAEAEESSLNVYIIAAIIIVVLIILIILLSRKKPARRRK